MMRINRNQEEHTEKRVMQENKRLKEVISTQKKEIAAINKVKGELVVKAKKLEDKASNIDKHRAKKEIDVQQHMTKTAYNQKIKAKEESRKKKEEEHRLSSIALGLQRARWFWFWFELLLLLG